VGPCHHGIMRPRIVDGGDGFQIWRTVANITNKQPREVDKGWSSSFGVGLTTLRLKKQFVMKCYIGPRNRIIWNDISIENGYEIWYMERS
jgi:hypothetical protein